MAGIAICAIFREEAPFLLEWIAHHRRVGVRHFVLYDNGSTDGGAQLVRESEFAGDVTVLDWPERPGQMSAYRDFILNHAPRFNWAAFIDIDEFILPLDAASIPELLPRYGRFSAVLLNWLVFGPSGFVRRPRGPVTQNYTRRLREPWDVNRHIKTLARTADLIAIGADPHLMLVRNRCCNARGEAIQALPIQPVACHDAMVINHYFTRSWEDWQCKLERGRATTIDPRDRYVDETFNSIRDNATVDDRRIARFSAGQRMAPGGCGATAPQPRAATVTAALAGASAA